MNYNNNYHEDDYLSKTSSLSTIADKFDSNLALAQDLLDMLDSLNDHSSTTNVSSLHMYIQQFLIQFDTRICMERKRRKRKRKYDVIKRKIDGKIDKTYDRNKDNI